MGTHLSWCCSLVLLSGTAGAVEVEEGDLPEWWTFTVKTGVVPGVSRLHAQAVDAGGAPTVDRRVDLTPGIGQQLAVEARWQSWWTEDQGFAWSGSLFTRRQEGTQGAITASMLSLGLEGGFDVLWAPRMDWPVDFAMGPRLGLGRSWQQESGLVLMAPGHGYLFTYGVMAGITTPIARDTVFTFEFGYQGFTATTRRPIAPEALVTGDGIMRYMGHGVSANVGIGREF